MERHATFTSNVVTYFINKDDVKTILRFSLKTIIYVTNYDRHSLASAVCGTCPCSNAQILAYGRYV
jgi:hypothetical protein